MVFELMFILYIEICSNFVTFIVWVMLAVILKNELNFVCQIDIIQSEKAIEGKLYWKIAKKRSLLSFSMKSKKISKSEVTNFHAQKTF